MSGGYKLSDKETQDLSERWIWLFKIHLSLITAILPFAIIWGSWMTVEMIKTISFRESGERFSKADSMALEARQVESRRLLLEAVQGRLQAIETDTAVIKASVERIEKEIAK